MCTFRLRFVTLGSIVSLAVAFAQSASAVVFQIGELDAQLDSTISIGGAYRTSNPSADYIGLANGGNQLSVNADNGNLNYEKGWFSKAIKMTNDFEVSG